MKYLSRDPLYRKKKTQNKCVCMYACMHVCMYVPEAIEGIPDKDYNFFTRDYFMSENLRYLKRCIYE